MWIRCCLILHNLIIRIEEGRDHEEWRAELIRTAQRHPRGPEVEDESSDGEESGDGADLHRALHLVRTEGQCFRLRVVNDLFNNPLSSTVRHDPQIEKSVLFA